VNVANKVGASTEPTTRATVPHRELALVVDDDEQVLRLVRRVLERAGFECVPVGNGRSAHGAAVEWRPDIILLDLQEENKERNKNPGSKVKAKKSN